MNPDNVVVKIDLEPKLKRPLSLWNPLDYLRLLYWIFYFPQALRWYEKTFNINTNISNARTFQKYWQWLRQNNALLNLILLGIVLVTVINYIGALVLSLQGFKIDWYLVSMIELISLCCTVFTTLVEKKAGIIMGVFSSFAIDVLFVSLTIQNEKYSLNLPITDYFLFTGKNAGMFIGAIHGLFINIFFSLERNIAINLAGDIGFGLSTIIVAGLAGSILISAFFSINLGSWVITHEISNSLEVGIAFGLSFCFTWILSYFLFILRVESWLIGTLYCVLNNHCLYSSHVSPIPIPFMTRKIIKSLKTDWNAGLFNANQILSYTLQFIPVIKAVNSVLSNTSEEHLLINVSILATSPIDWNLVKFSTFSLSDNLRYNFFSKVFIFPAFLRKRLIYSLNLLPRLDLPYRTAVAGFWYLHEGTPGKAFDSFSRLGRIPYNQEMCTLSRTLFIFNQTKFYKNTISAIAEIDILPIPLKPHLHPDSWVAISRFHRVINDVRILKTSHSNSAKSFALNRALGELDKLLKQSENLITAEKNLVSKIARCWQENLLLLTSEIGENAILQPVINSYIIGDPVDGSAFVGREDIINQLSELWQQKKSVQSVVLYGHRRMGKTSILRNINNYLGENVSLAYVNMLLSTNPQGETDILMFICDQIDIATGIPAPTNADFISFPQTTCRRYIQEVVTKIGNRKLIIALDEFEVIDTLIADQKISPEFLAFLRGLVQSSPHIAFAFAGLHTLEERIANYSDPFFASFIPIPVGFLSLGATRQLLANPADPDFPLDYTPETLDNIYQLTAGQPYLTQLVGFQLVRHYNQQVFESGHTRDPIFTIDDLNTVIQDPVFFDRGRYYFTGVWNQASQDVPHQQTILTALAPHPTGLTLSELSSTINLTLTELNAALKVLERHDVAVCEQQKWRISIELFRRWVIDSLSETLRERQW